MKEIRPKVWIVELNMFSEELIENKLAVSYAGIGTSLCYAEILYVEFEIEYRHFELIYLLMDENRRIQKYTFRLRVCDRVPLLFDVRYRLLRIFQQIGFCSQSKPTRILRREKGKNEKPPFSSIIAIFPYDDFCMCIASFQRLDVHIKEYALIRIDYFIRVVLDFHNELF